MRISAKAQYACLAVLDLAFLVSRPDPVRLAELATRNGIPERFLLQILLQLKRAGLIHSIRGAAGGYRLLVSPDKISVWDVIQLVNGTSSFPVENRASRRGNGWNVLRKVWHNVNTYQETKLKQTDFHQLRTQLTVLEPQMYHI